MIRLFVAIQPPAAIRAALCAKMGQVAGARWQSDAQLHLTLRFIGAVDENVARDVAATLACVSHPALSLSLSGIGQFERKGVIDTLWAGVAPREPLFSLHKKIDHALTKIGFESEHRRFVPHITLARFGRAGGIIDAFVGEHGDLVSAAFSVAWFGLYESITGNEGSSYHLLARYPLGAVGAG